MPPPRRPFVAVNFAITWDGRVSTRKKTPADFSSRGDKRRLLEIRATGDAVLVGAGTLVADKMTMGMPAEDLRAARRERKQTPYPLRVVLTNSGRLDPTLPIFQKDFSRIVIFSTIRMPDRFRQALASMADLWLHEGDQVNLRAMLTALREEYRVRRVICEGGPRVFRSLLVARLVDEIYLTLCPRLFGGSKAATLTGLAGAFLPKSIRCELKTMEVVDAECFLRYRVLP
ncbi:MAG: dihydrofolate reductase family protein [Verrucomicrobiota bacterium]|nr:dihydrofolate reductase family protein [Verrucomicrobiota bacterium]